MKTLRRLKQIETLTLAKSGNYDVDYVYDDKGRIGTETITGDVVRTTVYIYDDATDNIVTETITENGDTTVKTYQYDPVTNDIKKIQVRKQ